MGVRRHRVPKPSCADGEKRPEDGAHAGACLAATALLSALLVLAGPACSRQMATALGRAPSEDIAGGRDPWAAPWEGAPEPAGEPGLGPAGSADGGGNGGGAQPGSAANAGDAPLSQPFPPVALGAGVAAVGALLLVHRIVRHAVRDGVTEAVLLLENPQLAPPGCSPVDCAPADCAPLAGRVGGVSRPPTPSPTPCGGRPACPDAPRCGQRDR